MFYCACPFLVLCLLLLDMVRRLKKWSLQGTGVVLGAEAFATVVYACELSDIKFDSLSRFSL